MTANDGLDSNIPLRSKPDILLAPRAIPKYGAEQLCIHAALFLLASITLLVCFRLPRAFARFWRFGEWSSGHFLRHAEVEQVVHAPVTVQRKGTQTSKVSAAPRMSPASSLQSRDGEKHHATDDSHTLVSHNQHHLRRRAYDENGAEIRVSYPPHIVAVPRFLRPLAPLFRKRVDTGFSVAQVAIMTIYFATLMYAGLYKSSPFTDPVRTGWVAMTQVPFVVFFASKTNLLGMLLGVGYEKLNFIHRFVGTLVVLALNIHSIGYIYKWTLAGVFTHKVTEPDVAWAFTALVAFDFLAFFSTSYWRRRAYNIFIASHHLGFMVLLPALSMHKRPLARYVFATYAVYGVDLLLRLLKTRVSTAILRPLAEMDSTRIEVPYLNAGWRAGQHVRVRILTFGLGLWGWTEIHPFTIASISKGQEGLVLIAKKAGTWTRRLYEMSDAGGLMEGGLGQSVKVMIEGPYGGPGHTIFTSFSAAVFVVGGSGITFALSLMQDLIRQDLRGLSRVKIIELIWVLPDVGAVDAFLPVFTSMIQDSVYTPVHISVHYTRAAPLPTSAKAGRPARPVRLPAHLGITMTAGRPRIQSVLDTAIGRAVSLGAGAKDTQRISGVVVGVCGPASLGDDVSAAISRVDPARRDQVGGIEVYEEVFGW